MTQTLELKGGDLITPHSLFDVMEVVEEYMGCDIRQYLEEFLDGTEQPEDVGSGEGEKDVLLNLLDKVDDVDMEMQRTRIDRAAVVMHLNAMRRMIRREL